MLRPLFFMVPVEGATHAHTIPTLLQIPDAQLSDLSRDLQKHRTREKASNEFNQRQKYAVHHKEGEYSLEAMLSQLSLNAFLIYKSWYFSIARSSL